MLFIVDLLRCRADGQGAFIGLISGRNGLLVIGHDKCFGNVADSVNCLDGIGAFGFDLYMVGERGRLGTVDDKLRLFTGADGNCFIDYSAVCNRNIGSLHLCKEARGLLVDVGPVKAAVVAGQVVHTHIGDAVAGDCVACTGCQQFVVHGCELTDLVGRQHNGLVGEHAAGHIGREDRSFPNNRERHGCFVSKLVYCAHSEAARRYKPDVLCIFFGCKHAVYIEQHVLIGTDRHVVSCGALFGNARQNRAVLINGY